MTSSPMPHPSDSWVESYLARDEDWRITTSIIVAMLSFHYKPRVFMKLYTAFSADGLDRLAKLSVSSCHAMSAVVSSIDYFKAYLGYGNADTYVRFWLVFWSIAFLIRSVQRLSSVRNQGNDYTRIFSALWIIIGVSFISAQLARLARLPWLPDSLFGRVYAYPVAYLFAGYLYDDIFQRGGNILGWLSLFHDATSNWTYGIPQKLPLSRVLLNDSLPKAGDGSFFEHEHLKDNKDMIRLIKLLPSKDPAKSISCEILHVSLSSVPDYEALSYTWGGQKAECVIYCKTKRLLVTRNLFLALARLRLPDHTRLIWADAVCIDQKNMTEKTHQVRMMKEIYQAARRVVIWLGEDEGNSHSAIALLGRLVDVWREQQQQLQDHEVTGTPTDTQRPLSKVAVGLLQKDRTRLGLPPSHDPSYNALDALFQRSYFRRVWIVQEIVMARETQVLCGTSPLTLSWDDLVAVLRYIPDLAAYTIAIPSALELGQMIERTRAAVIQGDTKRLRLSTLLSRHNCFQATEPKDNIIGIIGMASSHLNIKVDYNMNTDDFFRSAALELLKEDRSLDILGDVDHGKELAGVDNGNVPSWVPRWQTSRAFVSEASETTRLADYGPFQSCGEYVSWDVSVREEQGSMRLLDVEGHMLDTVAVVGTYWSEFVNFIEDDAVYKDWEERVANVYKGGRNLYPATGETVLEAYWKTLHLGEMPPNLTRKLNSIYMAGRLLLRLLRQTPITGLVWFVVSFILALWCSFLDQASRVFPQLGGERMMFIKNSEAEYYIYHRRLFERRMIRTDEHRFIGLAPVATRPGDKIFLFKGSRVPIAVRQDGDRWLVVGDCYVHGVMGGEAFDPNLCGKHTLA
ncbi:heterokaryon incompatibility protein-domain-containing protein [Hypoxylon crocopeplum]|nr:heterokaryon incompatibility protein-domain-containing protein [Hypoxylon crocopeplum]